MTDLVHTIGMGELDILVIAQVNYRLRSICTVFEQDMTFNSNFGVSEWSTAPQTPLYAFDVESVALHEFGHWGILGHVSCPGNAVMRPNLSRGLQKRTLTSCDSIGMLYQKQDPPSCIWEIGACWSWGLEVLDTLGIAEIDAGHNYANADDKLHSNGNELALIYGGDDEVNAMVVDLLADISGPIDALSPANLNRAIDAAEAAKESASDVLTIALDNAIASVRAYLDDQSEEGE